MDKRDIYEHLAKIYLDASAASSKKRRKSKKNFSRYKIPLFIGAGVFVISSLFFLPRNKLFHETALILQSEAVKINFNFDPAKKETLTFSLNNLNMARFKALGFSLRKLNIRDTISLRVELVNSFNEKSEVYLNDISQKWQGYKINLADFRGIIARGNITGLIFTVEEWNAKEKSDVVYIDNIRLIK